MNGSIPIGENSVTPMPKAPSARARIGRRSLMLRGKSGTLERNRFTLKPAFDADPARTHVLVGWREAFQAENSFAAFSSGG